MVLQLFSSKHRGIRYYIMFAMTLQFINKSTCLENHCMIPETQHGNNHVNHVHSIRRTSFPPLLEVSIINSPWNPHFEYWQTSRRS
jgi:hypothetical protein